MACRPGTIGKLRWKAYGWITDAGALAERAERERLAEDLSTYLTCSAADLAIVRDYRGNHNCRGFAPQLCALRYVGFAPYNLTTAPATAVTYMARQLTITSVVLQAYARHAQP
jgi:hypothetical protein